MDNSESAPNQMTDEGIPSIVRRFESFITIHDQHYPEHLSDPHFREFLTELTGWENLEPNHLETADADLPFRQWPLYAQQLTFDILGSAKDGTGLWKPGGLYSVGELSRLRQHIDAAYRLAFIRYKLVEPDAYVVDNPFVRPGFLEEIIDKSKEYLRQKRIREKREESA